jgi:hypothetical protein
VHTILLQLGVIAEIDRSHRFCKSYLISTGKRFHDSREAVRLIVPFNIIPDKLSLEMRRVNRSQAGKELITGRI